MLEERDRTPGTLPASPPAARFLVLPVALLGVGAAAACGAIAGVAWSGWQWAIALLIAFDLTGGVAAMPLPSLQERVRGAGQPLRPIVFTAAHIHPLLLAMALPGLPWLPMILLYVCGVTGVSLLATLRFAFAPGLALAWCAGGITAVYTAGDLQGLEWLAPAYLLKLVGTYAAPDWKRH